jgi:hypothetical protein
MVNYANTKIYEIRIPGTDLVYIGHTTKKYLSDRQSVHRCDMVRQPNKMPYRLFLAFGMSAADIVLSLVSTHVCDNVDEAKDCERAEIKRRGHNCVNMTMPGRTKKMYYTDNKDIVNAKCKAYHEEHKEVINTRTRKYHEEHKQEIAAKRSIKIPCEHCGRMLAGYCMNRHIKKHCKGAPNDFVSQ